ncbi:MAG TPA: SUF system NifU family Fe-S cluster assembly protein [Acidimicrobiia bacterium]|nr:SUF system NifU family Fe-S cluster assembly protein [Acidimicrobiia bacterium]
MALEELYREVILDHYRNPRNRAPLATVDAAADGVNPLCGDEIHLELQFDGDTVAAVSVSGHGCSISQSSASMMSEAIKGKSRDEIEQLVERFRGMMDLDSNGSDALDPERPGAVLGDLEALQGVRNYPVRIKCANLAWTTLHEALTSP